MCPAVLIFPSVYLGACGQSYKQGNDEREGLGESFH